VIEMIMTGEPDPKRSFNDIKGFIILAKCSAFYGFLYVWIIDTRHGLS
jgi:hypothetical protein